MKVNESLYFSKQIMLKDYYKKLLITKSREVLEVTFTTNKASVSFYNSPYR